ncbi:Triokinase/FMN cyclase [Hondaea fermentalgiana]|uniref:Triokinase/FMN cyclase n=1 Tax=Hondaea fermentalgiana TaxID=2315210 RepID=A0A2R5G195_9STRA|nr:Triokinase/FMN cyclase [Hondaea fermentalgiana]|eukprot:GBG24780.1 Triokinase/FMN cyclase [Hondaea fermentalgiana]
MGGNASKSSGGQVTAKKFLNDNGANCVEEMLEGMAKMHPKELLKIDGMNVMVRADYEKVKQEHVVLISGGGSGHEPSHAGYCGPGMLTAAVCGNVFASPGTDAVLNTIRSVTGPKGCLLVVKNYTGDRLNFGLAAEQAKSEGFKVEMVIVGDDAALSGKGVTGRRGLAGTVLVHKVAGAVAAAGGDLDAVLAAAESVSSAVRTVGVALSTCNVPGKAISDRLVPTDGKMELGLGIHGEPGRETLDLLSTDELVRRLSDIIMADFQKIDGKKPKRVALVINNTGGTTPIEIYGICNSALKQLADKPFDLTVERIYAGPIMTSLEMQGFSLSLLALDLDDKLDASKMLAHLDAETTTLGWPGPVSSFTSEAKVSQPKPVSKPPSNASEAQQSYPTVSSDLASTFEKKIRAAAKELIDKEPKLTEWDKICGDGDAGHTFQSGAKMVLEALDAKQVNLTVPALTAAAMAEQARKMGGTSGAVSSIFFHAVGTSLQHSLDYGAAIKAGCDAITRYGGAEPGMRTMLDALHAMTEGYVADLSKLADKSMAAAKSTAEMNASAGRSNYIPDEKMRGVPDPGAMAVAYAMRALADA